MHDPMTVAFELRYPWKSGSMNFRYRAPWLTIWHVDPENCRGKLGVRSEDSCGWTAPPYTSAASDAIIKLAKREYREIFSRQVYTAEGKDYADVGYEPSAYDAVYWAWRALKHHCRRDGVWKYGDGLTAAELEQIQILASNPVDNLRHVFAGVKDDETFADFFQCVFRNFSRFYRPWYRHPRWHVRHWKLQFHPWQSLRRRFWDKCSRCGKRGFPKGVSAIGTWGGDQIWHSTCDEHSPGGPSVPS